MIGRKGVIGSGQGRSSNPNRCHHFTAPTERTPSSRSCPQGHPVVATKISGGLEGCAPSQPRVSARVPKVRFPRCAGERKVLSGTAAPTERTPSSRSAGNGHPAVATKPGRKGSHLKIQEMLPWRSISIDWAFGSTSIAFRVARVFGIDAQARGAKGGTGQIIGNARTGRERKSVKLGTGQRSPEKRGIGA
jgi:hypothetical protein